MMMMILFLDITHQTASYIKVGHDTRATPAHSYVKSETLGHSSEWAIPDIRTASPGEIAIGQVKDMQ